MGRVVVVQNDATGGPGRFGTWLTEAGLNLEVVHAYDGAPVPEQLDGRALVVLGGGYMPDEDGRAPWLAATRRLAAQALEQGAPFFGICLGGQLLAHVAGGTVKARHGAPEAGSTPLRLRADASGDALFHNLPGRVTAIERHVDSITALPPGAVWLMESERCPYQAFRVGERAWGVQFHPEAAAERIRGWNPERLRQQGFDPEELQRTAEGDEPAAEAVWRRVALRFSAVAAG
ncbi:type 1 glutamine amidotransferase [Streptomyces sp. TP-A0874]|uniref:type 1 glutamine amidotransferase n=1 Tax=Streptomyces sp. TP-A0874 TaxID=549819 RepID=UPI00085376A4|nr:type 1 glutamine amidotransferase [Streptomyces sp. TP-A0874]